MKHIIMTRFSVHQKEWKERPTEEWLAERWELFAATAASVEKQTVPYEWWLICHHSTPPEYLYSLRQNGRVIVVDNDWLPIVQKLMPEGLKITTRLDSDDIIAPNYLETVQEVARESKVPGFICAERGYQKEEENYFLHEEENGPFLSYVEKGKLTVYCRAHGNVLKREQVTHFKRRLYIQVIHNNNMRNKLHGSNRQVPSWV